MEPNYSPRISVGGVLRPTDIFQLYLSNKHLGKSQISCLVELDGFEMTFGFGLEDIPMVHLIYGLIYRDQAQLSKSERRLQLALQGFENLDHAFFPLAIIGLGTVYLKQGKINSAELAFAQALLPRKSGTLVDMIALYNIACSFETRGMLEAAESLFNTVQRDLASLLGHTHCVTLLASCRLADLYVRRGEAEQLTQLHKDAIDRVNTEITHLESDSSVTASLIFRALSL